MRLLTTVAHPELSIAGELDRQYQKMLKKNREILASIILAVIHCGRTGEPLRGHRDHGPLHGGDGGGGNFNELLRYAEQSGNVILAEHNSSGPQNATYRSPEIQNELIFLCGEYIRRGILDRIRSAELYSLMADETTDISTTEQMTIVIRYFDGQTIREDFLGFTSLERGDMTGRNITSQANNAY